MQTKFRSRRKSLVSAWINKTRPLLHFSRFIRLTAIMVNCSREAISGYQLSSACHDALKKENLWQDEDFSCSACYSFHVVSTASEMKNLVWVITVLRLLVLRCRFILCICRSFKKGICFSSHNMLTLATRIPFLQLCPWQIIQWANTIDNILKKWNT